MPFCLVEPKHARGGIDRANRLTASIYNTLHGFEAGFEQINGWYLAVDGTAVRPRMESAGKTAIEPGTRTAADQQYFEYESLNAGQQWAAWVSGDKAAVDTATGRLTSATLNLGRSRRAEFGGGFQGAAGELPMPSAGLIEKQLVLWCLSDLVLIDEWGKQLFAPSLRQLLGENSIAETPLSEMSCIRTTSYLQRNAKLGAYEREFAVIRAGSVLVYDLDQSIDAEPFAKGIGMFRERGMGMVWVNPFWMRENHPFPLTIESAETERAAIADAPAPEATDWFTAIKRRQSTLDQRADRVAVDIIFKELSDAVKQAAKYCPNLPGAAQWGRLSNLLESATHDDDIVKMLAADEWLPLELTIKGLLTGQVKRTAFAQAAKGWAKMSEETAIAKPLLAPIRHILRLVVEAKSPLSIGSGEADLGEDVLLFRDWNGLPCIPGTAIAGVLRHLWRETYGDTDADIFGFAKDGSKSSGSSLCVSFAHAHASDDKPRSNWLSDKDLNDSVLKLLLQPAPIKRDHVRIDAETGAAAAHAKFDRAACPVGTRFTFELMMDGDNKEGTKALLLKLAGLITLPHARFGGATRNGYGKLAIERAHYCSIDRSAAGGRDKQIAWLNDTLQWNAPLPKIETPAQPDITKDLKFKWQWQIGASNKAWGNAQGEHNAQWQPRENIISWPEGGATITPRLIIPASGIKGALAHRAEFHLRRILGTKANDATRQIDALFGKSGGDGKSGDDKDGEAGRVFIDDILVDENHTPHVRARNQWDRHSRKVRLFNQGIMPAGTQINLSISIRNFDEKADAEKADAKKALIWAIDDLCNGQLALGSGDGIGDGVLEMANPIEVKAA